MALPVRMVQKDIRTLQQPPEPERFINERFLENSRYIFEAVYNHKNGNDKGDTMQKQGDAYPDPRKNVF